MSINAVVVGYGKSLNTKLFHCQAIKATEGLNLYGVCARNPQYQEEAKRLYGAKVFSDLEEVLRDDRVALVVIATPSDLHADMAVQALNAGKNVVVEKPMCLKTSEAETMIEASRRRGLLLTVRQNRRWDSDFLTVQKAMTEGILGTVFLLQIANTDLMKPSGWRTQRSRGGGVLYDIGAHLIDQALQLIGAKPVHVYASLGHWGSPAEAETYARVFLKFDDGRMADLEMSHLSWLPRPRWYVLGDRGSLIQERNKARARSQAGETELACEPERAGDFYRNVKETLEGKAKLAVTPEETKTVVGLIEAALGSAESGKVIEL
jgi:predicted dehydrogenase